MVMIYIIARMQADWRDQSRSASWLSHLFWLSPFIVFVLFYIVLRHEYTLALTLAVERCVFFNQLLNYFRNPRKPFFYLGTINKTGDFKDIAFEAFNNAWPFIWIVFMAFYVILNIKLFL